MNTLADRARAKLISPSSVLYILLQSGVVFSLSGFKNPFRTELREKMVEMGASFTPDWNSSCTHLMYDGIKYYCGVKQFKSVLDGEVGALTLTAAEQDVLGLPTIYTVEVSFNQRLYSTATKLNVLYREVSFIWSVRTILYRKGAGEFSFYQPGNMFVWRRGRTRELKRGEERG